MSDSTFEFDGLVIYADGSFRKKRGGWGFHGYFYKDTPLTKGIGNKQLPTTKGYAPVEMSTTVTPVKYVDAFGSVGLDPSNNTGELEAVIQAIEFANQYGLMSVLIFTDSKYVKDGINRDLKKWSTNGWVKSNGDPVANQTYWKRLHALLEDGKARDQKIRVEWIKGHSGHLGNDASDVNAKTGSGNRKAEPVTVLTDPEGYHNPKVDANPLFMKTRMLFNLGGPDHRTETGAFYYQYQLGRMGTYGHKQHDSQKERHNKTDLLLGRRIADATFCVIKLPEPDAYLETLMELHEKAHLGDTVELAVARLDHAYKPVVHQRIHLLGEHALVCEDDNQSLLTPNDELVTKTLNPPRLAREAVDMFGILEEQLKQHEAGTFGKGTTVVDVTDSFYGKELKGKNKDKEVCKLHTSITTATSVIEVPVTHKDHDVTIRLVVNVDIPGRNALAKLATVNPKVDLVITADGPYCYSFGVIVKTDVGTALYRSPYTQFVIPKE